MPLARQFRKLLAQVAQLDVLRRTFGPHAPAVLAERIDAMLSSRAFPQLEAIVWFSERKEVDWRIDSSDHALLAFRNWFANKPSPGRH